MNKHMPPAAALLTRLTAVAALLLCVGMAGAGAPAEIHTQTMPSMEPLTHELMRGQSTRADVQRLLGTPTGNGGSVLPPDRTARDVWFYQAVSIKDFTAERPLPSELHGESFIRVNMTQQILLVFFKGDLYDGFMWYSNAGAIQGKVH